MIFGSELDEQTLGTGKCSKHGLLRILPSGLEAWDELHVRQGLIVLDTT